MNKDLKIGIGIFFLFLATLAIPFLIAQNTTLEEELISRVNSVGETKCVLKENFDYSKEFSIDSYSSYYPGKRMSQGIVIFEKSCSADISGLLDLPDSTLIISQGIQISRKGDKSDYVLEPRGPQQGIVDFRGKRYFLEKGEGDFIRIDENLNLVESKFLPKAGEAYPIKGYFQDEYNEILSVTPPNSERIYYDPVSGELNLPEGAVINRFGEDFHRIFERGSYLHVSGENIQISEDASKEIFGEPSSDFRIFSGTLGFAKAELRTGGDNEAPRKVFAFLPRKKSLSFPKKNLGLSAGNSIFNYPISFDSQESDSIIETFQNEFVLGDDNYYSTAGGGGVGAKRGIFLEDDSMSVLKGNNLAGTEQEQDLLSINFKEGSDYAGFDVGEGQFFGSRIRWGDVSFKDKTVSSEKVDSDLTFIAGPDTLEKRGKNLLLGIGDGAKKKSTIAQLKLAGTETGKIITLPDAAETTAYYFKKGLQSLKIYSASTDKEYDFTDFDEELDYSKASEKVYGVKVGEYYTQADKDKLGFRDVGEKAKPKPRVALNK